MPSPWDAAKRATDRVFDRVAGEDWLLQPQAPPTDTAGVADPNARRVASTARPAPIPFRGLFFDKGAPLYAHGRSMADSTTRPIAAESPFLEYAEGDLPGQSRQGDLITRLKTGVVYRVSQDAEADIGRRRIILAERSQNGRPT